MFSAVLLQRPGNLSLQLSPVHYLFHVVDIDNACAKEEINYIQKSLNQNVIMFYSELHCS